MASRSIFVVGVVIVALSWDLRARAKVFKRCELARELALKQVAEEQIGDWLCIAEHGSKFNSSAVNLKYKRFGGSAYYGVFQISDLYGCLKSSSICGITCADLKDDEVEDDIDCMLRIYGEYSREIGDGFAAWPTHKKHCRDHAVKTSFRECLNEDVMRFQVYYKKKKAKAKKTEEEVKAQVGKVYERCELAKELRDKYKLPEDQIATWVCIAYHESRFNTSAEGRLNADGSGDHGLFQISDIYWCSYSNKPGKACGVTCEDMRNSDIGDDIRCIQMIYDEHRRISGNGFNAWSVYKPYCQGNEESFIHNCFDDTALTTAIRPRPGITAPTQPGRKSAMMTAAVGKIYDRCELANDLLHKFNFPREQVATWVCIAYHESSFNTSAEGRLNADGSGDHGLFQISDIYWCSPPGNGWACGVTCEDLKDSDITDDVKCVRTIYEEHQRLSGNGFNAWSVYKPFCEGQSDSFTRGCFGTDDDQRVTIGIPRPAITAPTPIPHRKTSVTRGKVYDRCELARELYFQHHYSYEDSATWTCIAQYQSNFNTAAVGGVPGDVQYHGMFQLSDEYWCSPPGRGWVCGLTCSDLEDDDITDDLACMRHIYEEHQRISGDGFNAWAVYQPYCKGKSQDAIRDCFEGVENAIAPTTTRPTRKKNVGVGKIYERCELARELYLKHHYSYEDSAMWTCIAQHQSNFNTAAVGGTAGDVQYHGMFQLSDEYWCSPPGRGTVCGLSCSDLKDNDITDDLACLSHIYEEHQRISGDGFNAWPSYQANCKGKAQAMIKNCFEEGENVIPLTTSTTRRPTEPKNVGVGKIYERCELARELFYTHNLPYDQIATWVCIAHRESNYNVSAIGRLNADGSEDHGLFQISDIYWCSPPGKGWVCGVACSDLEDNDLTDDIECMKTIFAEHTRLSGDGFTAWSVYNPYCKGRSDHYINGCFDEPSTTISTTPRSTRTPSTTQRTTYSWSSSTIPTTPRTTRWTLPPATTISTTSRSTTIKSSTSLYDFYLHAFGRPNTTPASFAAFPLRTTTPSKTATTSSGRYTSASSAVKSQPTISTRTTRATNATKTAKYSSFDQLFNNFKHS